jgi:hypothetical protein
MNKVKKIVTHISTPRRRFLQASILGLSASAGSSVFSFPMIGGGYSETDQIAFITSNRGQVQKQTGRHAVKLWLEDGGNSTLEINYLPSFAFIDKVSHAGFGICDIERKHCYVYNSASGMRRTLNIRDSNNIITAGAFSPDGSNIILAETNAETDEGWISIWNRGTFKLTRKIPSRGSSPNSVEFNDDGSKLIVFNSGSPFQRHENPNLTIVDLRDQKLSDSKDDIKWLKLEECSLLTELPKIQNTNLHKKRDGDVLLVSNEKIIIIDRVGSVKTIPLNQRVGSSVAGLSSTLSDSENTLAIAVQESNRLTLVDLDAGNIISHTEVKSPRLLKFDRTSDAFIFSSGFENRSLEMSQPGNIINRASRSLYSEFNHSNVLLT